MDNTLIRSIKAEDLDTAFKAAYGELRTVDELERAVNRDTELVRDLHLVLQDSRASLLRLGLALAGQTKLCCLYTQGLLDGFRTAQYMIARQGIDSIVEQLVKEE